MNPSEPNQLGDKRFVELLVGKSSLAWRDFDRRYAPGTKRVIRQVLSKFDRLASAEDARDAYADLCASLLAHDARKLRQFDPERGALGVWLRRVAARVAYDHLRRLRRQSRESEVELGSFGTTSDTGADAARSERARMLAAALGRLPVHDREILALELLDASERDELVQRLRISARALSSRKRRALERLRRLVVVRAS